MSKNDTHVIPQYESVQPTTPTAEPHVDLSKPHCTLSPPHYRFMYRRKGKRPRTLISIHLTALRLRYFGKDSNRQWEEGGGGEVLLDDKRFFV